MVGLICHTKDRVGSLEILVSRELQTGSTGLAVEAVPEREVSCLTLELQTWLLQWAVALYWSWKILACRGSCKLGLLQLAVALVLWMEVLASRSGSTGLTVAAAYISITIKLYPPVSNRDIDQSVLLLNGKYPQLEYSIPKDVVWSLATGQLRTNWGQPTARVCLCCSKVPTRVFS